MRRAGNLFLLARPQMRRDAVGRPSGLRLRQWARVRFPSALTLAWPCLCAGLVILPPNIAERGLRSHWGGFVLGGEGSNPTPSAGEPGSTRSRLSDPSTTST